MKFQFDNFNRKIGEIMAKVKENNQKKRNPILWILFAVIIPLLIVSFLAVVILNLVGVDVNSWVKEKGSTIPVVSSFIETDEEKELKRQLEQANETIQNQAEEIDVLNQEIQHLENMLDDLELEIEKLENKNKSEEALLEGSDLSNEEELKQVAASFRKMDPESAAQIIQNLDQSNAIAILSSLSGDVRGNILAEMEPGKAAQITAAMMNQ